MKPYRANMINAIVLIVVGLLGYFSANMTPTALIPVGFGVVLLLATKGMVSENKAVAHVVVLLTLVIIIMLFFPLKRAIVGDNMMRIIRIGLMIGSSIFAFIVFIGSFRAARKARETAK